jgi:hypothetical protein
MFSALFRYVFFKHSVNLELPFSIRVKGIEKPILETAFVRTFSSDVIPNSGDKFSVCSGKRGRTLSSNSFEHVTAIRRVFNVSGNQVDECSVVVGLTNWDESKTVTALEMEFASYEELECRVEQASDAGWSIYRGLLPREAFDNMVSVARQDQ